MLQRILVATDGSDNGYRAMSLAMALARRHGSALLVCHVVDRAGVSAERFAPSGGGASVALVHASDEAAEQILAAAAKRATEAGLVVATALLAGRSAPAIVDCAKERNVDAIVMGTQGKRGLERLFLGSTAEGVLRRTDVPVFVVPHCAREPVPALEHILVAIDGSDPSDAAAGFALDLAEAEHVPLVFCGVAEIKDLLDSAAASNYDPAPMLAELRVAAEALLEVQAARASERRVACQSFVFEGDPVDEILKSAEAHHAGTIVVGTHGRRGLRRLFVGSVAENVILRSPVPVVVVRAASYRASSARKAAAATSAAG